MQTILEDVHANLSATKTWRQKVFLLLDPGDESYDHVRK